MSLDAADALSWSDRRSVSLGWATMPGDTVDPRLEWQLSGVSPQSPQPQLSTRDGSSSSKLYRGLSLAVDGPALALAGAPANRPLDGQRPPQAVAGQGPPKALGENGFLKSDDDTPAWDGPLGTALPSAALRPVADRVLFSHLGDEPLVPLKPTVKPDPAAQPQAQGFRAVPREALKLYMQARSHWNNRRFAQAVTALEQARQLDPLSYQVDLMLGRIYLLAGQLKRSQDCLETAVANTPENFEAYYLLAKVHAAKREYAKVIDALKTGLSHRSLPEDLGPKVAQAWLLLGRAFQDQKQYAQAVSAYRSLLGALEREVRPTSGEEIEILKYGQNPAPIFGWLRQCFVALGDKPRAVRAAANAVALDLANRTATGELVEFLIAEKRNEAALAVVARFCECTNETRDGLVWLERTAAELGWDEAQSLDLILQLQRRRPQHTATLKYTVDRLKALNRTAEADELLNRAGVEVTLSAAGLIQVAQTRQQAGQWLEALRGLAVALTSEGWSESDLWRLETAYSETLGRAPDRESLATVAETGLTPGDLAGEYLAATASVVANSLSKSSQVASWLANLHDRRPTLAPVTARLADLSAALAQTTDDLEDRAEWLNRGLKACLKTLAETAKAQNAVNAGGAKPQVSPAVTARAAYLEWLLFETEILMAQNAPPGGGAAANPDDLLQRLARIESHVRLALALPERFGEISVTRSTATAPQRARVGRPGSATSDPLSELSLRLLMIDSLSLRDQFAAALTEATKAVDSAPNEAAVVVAKVRTLCLTGQTTKAVEAADAFLSQMQWPARDEVLVAKARALLVMYEYSRAAEALREALTVAAGNPAAQRRIRLELVMRVDLSGYLPRGGHHRLVGNENFRAQRPEGVLVLLDQPGQAAAVMADLIAEEKANPPVIPPGPNADEIRAEWTSRLTALELLRLQLLIDAKDIPAARALAAQLPVEGTLGAEVLRWRLAVAAAARDDAAMTELMVEYRGALSEQETFARLVAREWPAKILSDKLVAEALRDGGRFDLAEQIIRKAIAQVQNGPVKTELKIVLAQLLMSDQRRDMPGAIAILDELIEAARDDGNTEWESRLHSVMSGLHQRAKNMEAAVKSLEAAYELTPDDVGLNNDLGYTWADMGRNLKAAREMIQKAVNADPHNAAFRDSLGWVLYKLGDFAGARENLLKATEGHEGADPVLWDHLGDCLWRLGDKAAAMDAWTRSANLYTESRRKDPTEAARVQTKIKTADDGDQPALAPVGELPAVAMPQQP